jgi:uncharacterized protein (TIGR02246 family)
MAVEPAVVDLYRQLLDAWNIQDAAQYAALFADDASVVGFDGSQMNGRVEIDQSIGSIFADHRTASYVHIVREVRQLSAEVVLLRAVAGMVPPGGSDIKQENNAVQSLVAVNQDGTWRIALFHNTPAALHGRPEAVETLTNELRGVLKSQM